MMIVEEIERKGVHKSNRQCLKKKLASSQGIRAGHRCGVNLIKAPAKDE